MLSVLAMKISIEEFVKTGNFGPINIGMSKADIIGCIGAPDSDNDMGENGFILIYAWYELFINHEDKLTSIQNDNYDPKNPESYTFENEKIEVDPWFLNDVLNQTIESVSKLLKSSGVNFDLADYYGRSVIKVDSGVIIDFSEEKNQNGVRELSGIRYWP